MRLLLRRPQQATILAALLFLIALPLTWADRAPWHGIAPTLSYAGGSPDETLGPQPRRAGTIVRAESDGGERTARPVAFYRPAVVVHGLGSGDWLLLWRINLTSLLRF